MSTNVQRQDYTPQPPPLEEGYWSSLLREGETLESFPESTDNDIGTWPYEQDPTSTQSSTDGNWDELKQTMDNDEVLELTAVGFNRGGLLVEWRNLRGFVPASQLIDFPAHMESNARRNELMARIDKILRLRVIELDAKQNRLILSERAAQAQPGERADVLTRLKPGDTTSGFVTNLCDFGAFVDLGGLEGLIHISELSWGRVGHPKDLLHRGQEIHAYVMDVDRDAGRIALSLKRLHPDPWEHVDKRYRIGEMVKGVITNVVDFGAFACIEEGLEGLIHVSELAEGHFLHPRNVVSEGQQVEARILNIDGRARRLGLSLRLGS